MHNLTSSKVVLLSAVLLLASSGYCLCASSRRFYYENGNDARRAHVEATDEDAASGETKLELLEENVNVEMPMEFYRQLDNVSDINELLEKFVDKNSIDPQLGLQEKRSVERANRRMPQSAGCIPENAVVELTPPNSPKGIVVFPKCTRVKLCSGCCNAPEMSCQPIETETLNFEIVKLRNNTLVGREIVPVTQHLKCKCDCRLKEEDCNQYQVYDYSSCKCACQNLDERAKCEMQHEHKKWTEDCKCECNEKQTCTTGTIFDEHQCKCLDPSDIVPGLPAVPTRAAGTPAPAVYDRKRFILKAIPVEFNNSTIYHHV